ncbi:hypothetical protein KAI87_05900, partial [Myxococcota bacterium]|nr:hypothetical protein [Myxococcota bacterium]
RLEKDGFVPWQSDIFVGPGQTTAVWAELEAKIIPWYKNPWVWGGIGGAVITSVGASLWILSQADAPPATGTVEVNAQ